MNDTKNFYYRRRLDRKELLQLVGAAAGVGAAIAGVGVYVGRLWLQRVPLDPAERPLRLQEGARRNPALTAFAAGIVRDRTEVKHAGRPWEAEPL